jgi:predicted nucleic acid-binding protein
MKAYWDASALIETVQDADLYARLKQEGAFTRTHSLAETFSTLTGNQQFRFSANYAAEAIKGMVQYLEFVDVPAADIITALGKAQARGLRGGRVHDYLHALAAEKSGAAALLTLDKNDFNGLVPSLSIEQV